MCGQGSGLLSTTLTGCSNLATTLFLNQARAGRRPARAWFLEIAFVREVSMHVCVCVCVWMCVCPPPRP